MRKKKQKKLDKMLKNKSEKKNKSDKKEKSEKKEKKKREEKEEDLEPIPYHELMAEPSEENKSNMESQFMDDEGNIYNLDDLTDEEKMNILQQQFLLQKLQEEAELRGMDPQEYLAMLEQQEEEEEGMMQKKESDKLNKSF